MHVKSILSASLGGLALAVVASATNAAPAGGLANAVDRDVASGIEQVTWKRHRHCYWYRGYRHCYWGYGHYWGHRHYGWYRRPYYHSYYHRYW